MAVKLKTPNLLLSLA